MIVSAQTSVSSRIKLNVKMIDRNARRSPNKVKTSARKGVVISPSARLRNDDTGRKDLYERQPRVKRDRTPLPIPRSRYRRVYLKCARVDKEDLS